MDVTCERCSTAYEFDDALVSERGTTVKCTNCGHQFKVRRPQPLGAPERWLVRTIDGRELEFRALRELQAAIAQAVITRDDVLSRGGSRPRRLGSIAELEPFFSSVAGSGPAHSTSLGLGPRGPVITGHDGAAGPPARARPPAPQAQRGADASEAATLVQPPPPRRPPSAPPPRPAGLPGVIVGPGGAPPVPPAPPVVDEDAFFEDATRAEPRAARGGDDLTAPTTPFHVGQVLDPVKVRALAQEDWSLPAAPPSPPANGGPHGASAAAIHARAVAPTQAVDPDSIPDAPAAHPPRVAPRAAPPRPPPPPAEDDLDFPAQNQHTASVPPLTPTPGIVRTSDDDDLLEPRFSQAGAPRRSGAAKWIVASIFVGMAALAFATVGRKMLVPDAPAKGGQADARIGSLLADGEKSLADGDLEQAKEQFDKASVLGESDARTAGDLARLAAVKADVDWLRVRLVAPDDPELPALKRELEQATQRAQKAANRAGELAPADPAVIRSRVDALRLAGDVAGARRLVGGIASAGTQPDNALTLAELDLAEAKPDWPTILGRLRSALTTDGNLGRARSMLVYALARSGDAAAAHTELEHLGALPRPHPLVGALRAFVGRASSLDPNALPDAKSAKPAASGSASAPPAAPAAAVAHEPREPREPHEVHERPAPVEPRAPSPPPEEPVVPAAPAGAIDTSDLPGVKAPPTPAAPPPSPPTPPEPASPPSPPAPQPTHAPAPPANPAVPPGVDTSDLPGFK